MNAQRTTASTLYDRIEARKQERRFIVKQRKSAQYYHGRRSAARWFWQEESRWATSYALREAKQEIQRRQQEVPQSAYSVGWLEQLKEIVSDRETKKEGYFNSLLTS